MGCDPVVWLLGMVAVCLGACGGAREGATECPKVFYMAWESGLIHIACRFVDERGDPIRIGPDGAGINVFDTNAGAFQAGDLAVFHYRHFEFHPAATLLTEFMYNGGTVRLEIPCPTLENIYLGDVPLREGSSYVAFAGTSPDRDTAYAHRLSPDGIVDGVRYDSEYVASVRNAERGYFRGDSIDSDTLLSGVASGRNGVASDARYCYRVVLNRKPRHDTVMSADEYADFVLRQPFTIRPVRAVIPVVGPE